MVKRKFICAFLALIALQTLLIIVWCRQGRKRRNGDCNYQSRMSPDHISRPFVKIAKANKMGLKSSKHKVRRERKEMTLESIRHNFGREGRKLGIKSVRHNFGRTGKKVTFNDFRYNFGMEATNMNLKNSRYNIGREGKDLGLKRSRYSIGRKAKEMKLRNIKPNTGRNKKETKLKSIRNNVGHKAKEMEVKSFTIHMGSEHGTFFFHVYKAESTYNSATVVSNGCKKTNAAPGKIELITGFIDFVRNKKYRQTIGDIANRNDVIEARQMEVLDVLRENLLHPVIERVHMLVWDKETADYIRSLPLKNSDKLILRIMGKDVGLYDQLLYASECLPGRIIAITNQDNKIGKGWNNKEYHQILRDNDIMYALTRHSPVKTNCTWLNKIGTCDDGEWHISTHDTFVLRAKQWSSKVFNEINSITPDMLGMENLFMWFFQHKLHYRILNPCKKLFVHHHHCVPIRGANRPRVNTGGRSLNIDFTDRLNVI